MMLRSSSTPILGSLISSYSESPNHNHHSEFNSPKHVPKKLSFFHHTQAGHLHLTSPSSHSCNASPFVSDREISQTNGLRRAQSEGNLEGLLSDYSLAEFNHSKRFPRKPCCAVLQTIPSFSVYNPSKKYVEGEEDEEEEEEQSGEESEDEILMRGENQDLSTEFYNNIRFQNSNVHVQESDNNVLSKMHLASGLGVMPGGFGGGGYNEIKPREFGGEGGDEVSTEAYYKKMVEENPRNPLFLRNSAQFLHQSEKDLVRAEGYYSRAILADPSDGDILSQYAQLTWELHRDEERASSYFERAVQASPDDSHVQAAYAGFLWETEEAEDDLCIIPPLLQNNAVATAAF